MAGSIRSRSCPKAPFSPYARKIVTDIEFAAAGLCSGKARAPRGGPCRRCTQAPRTHILLSRARTDRLTDDGTLPHDEADCGEGVRDAQRISRQVRSDRRCNRPLSGRHGPEFKGFAARVVAARMRFYWSQVPSAAISAISRQVSSNGVCLTPASVPQTNRTPSATSRAKLSSRSPVLMQHERLAHRPALPRAAFFDRPMTAVERPAMTGDARPCDLLRRLLSKLRSSGPRHSARRRRNARRLSKPAAAARRMLSSQEHGQRSEGRAARLVGDESQAVEVVGRAFGKRARRHTAAACHRLDARCALRDRDAR